MNPTSILNLLLSVSPFFILKVFGLVLIFMYVIFAGVVLRQVDFMVNVICEDFSSVIRLAAIIHLVAAIMVFVIAVFVL